MNKNFTVRTGYFEMSLCSSNSCCGEERGINQLRVLDSLLLRVSNFFQCLHGIFAFWVKKSSKVEISYHQSCLHGRRNLCISLSCSD